jgi:hypothetical protein
VLRPARLALLLAVLACGGDAAGAARRRSASAGDCATADSTAVTGGAYQDVPQPHALLPRHRIVGFYGNPLSARMGILGALPPAAMLKRLSEQAAAYARADTTHPVLPALHLVAVVAQRAPGKDRMHRARMPDTLVERVAGWAESRGWLLFLDVQVGRSSVRTEVQRLLPFLRRPYVHLAIDPEFAMAGNQVPGKVIGSLDAADVNDAVELLAGVVAEDSIPAKVLVVHRFTTRMLSGVNRIRRDARVQVVIDMDGFGWPALKLDSYRYCVAREPVQYAGFKLFYQQDRPLMSVTDVLALKPAPLFVLYQ